MTNSSQNQGKQQRSASQHNQQLPVEVIVDTANLLVKAGQRIKLPRVTVKNDVKVGKKFLGYSWWSDQGEIKGPVYSELFYAPIIYGSGEEVVTLKAYSNYNPVEFKVIIVHVEKVQISLVVPPTSVVLKSRQKISISDLFKVENDSKNLGVIIVTPEGILDGDKFEAPEAKGGDLQFDIKGIAKADPTVEAFVHVVVKCVEIVWRNESSFNNIHAGQHQETGIVLQIETLYDPEGRKNYSCELKKGPGKLDTIGVYTPPKFLTETKEVQILIVSDFDRAIKKLFVFQVKPTEGVITQDFKCPDCKQPLVAGTFCKKCGYPKIKIFMNF
ncbi:hypothetical protein ACFL23_01545 [Patescibacteria group bacterium]